MSASTRRPGDDASIVVSGLRKLYGDVIAVDGIDFRVEPGEIVGFLGPNGAGKTTTMKILTGFMAADEGDARVAGHDVLEEPDAARRKIGYLPESVPLYDEMIVYDYLTFVAKVRGVERERRRGRIERVAEMCGLEEVIGRDIRALSKGYRQRVGLAQAIIHEPEVVILDEPTTGLDPNQIIEIRDVITSIGEEKTVIFSTHILQEVSAVCDRIILIHRGALIADGTLDELTARVAALRPGLIARFPADASPARPLRRLGNLERVTAVHEEDTPHSDSIAFRMETEDPDGLRRELYTIAAEEDFDLVALDTYHPDLEEVFRHFTAEADRQSTAAPDVEEEEAVEEGEVEGEEEEASSGEEATGRDEEDAVDDEDAIDESEEEE